MAIYGETGEKNIIIDYPSLLKKAGIKYNTQSLQRVKDSLERMNGCELYFHGIYYDPVAKKNGADFLKQTKRMYLISDLETISLQKFKKMKPETKKNYKEQFNRHKGIKEIASFSIHKYIANDINLKAFKYFDHQELLAIKNINARTIYVLLSKWRHWQKNRMIRRKAKFLASRIPLSWKPNSISSTIRTLERACEYLKKLKKIANYEINDKGKNATIDFYFNSDEKLDYYNSKVGIETTGQEYLEIKETKELPVKPLEESKQETTDVLTEPSKQTNKEPKAAIGNLQYLINLIPKSHQTGLKSFVQIYQKSKGFDYVKKYIVLIIVNFITIYCKIYT